MHFNFIYIPRYDACLRKISEWHSNLQCRPKSYYLDGNQIKYVKACLLETYMIMNRTIESKILRSFDSFFVVPSSTAKLRNLTVRNVIQTNLITKEIDFHVYCFCWIEWRLIDDRKNSLFGLSTQRWPRIDMELRNKVWINTKRYESHLFSYAYIILWYIQ